MFLSICVLCGNAVFGETIVDSDLVFDTEKCRASDKILNIAILVIIALIVDMMMGNSSIKHSSVGVNLCR